MNPLDSRLCRGAVLAMLVQLVLRPLDGGWAGAVILAGVIGSVELHYDRWCSWRSRRSRRRQPEQSRT